MEIQQLYPTWKCQADGFQINALNESDWYI